MLITEPYRELNRQLHAARVDYGAFSAKWAKQIIELVQMIGAKTILDYGCGKGGLGRALSHLVVINYDPAVGGLERMPDPADLVVCTDVLEHIEPECLEGVLDDLLRCTIRGIFLTIATRPAAKVLADGRNAHLIQQSLNWWLPKVMDRWSLRLLQATEGEFAVFAVRPINVNPHPGNGNGSAL